VAAASGGIFKSVNAGGASLAYTEDDGTNVSNDSGVT